MGRILRNVVVVLVLCGFSFAQPTGNVQLAYSSGACPGGAFSNFANPVLDGNGNYTNTWQVTLQPGSYCISAVYSGDGNYSGSAATPVTISTLTPTTVTLTVTPVSGGYMISGTVAPQ